MPVNKKINEVIAEVIYGRFLVKVIHCLQEGEYFLQINSGPHEYYDLSSISGLSAEDIFSLSLLFNKISEQLDSFLHESEPKEPADAIS